MTSKPQPSYLNKPGVRASIPTAIPRRDILAPLKSVKLINHGKPVLPLEIIAQVLDHLLVSDLMHCARVSKRLKEMVYDDTRWVQKLKAIGVWNEFEARKRFEDAMLRRRETLSPATGKSQTSTNDGGPTQSSRPSSSMTIFDLHEEEKKQERLQEEQRKVATLTGTMELPADLDVISTSGSTVIQDKPRRPPSLRDPSSLLGVLSDVRSMRGFARQEYGRIHGALAPLYFDLVKARTHMDPMIFRIYRDPEEQAKMLAQFKLFSQADSSQGWSERVERLNSMTSIFENAALREFEGGYEAKDIDGRMRRYANVLILLNGGIPCVQLFVQKHPVMFERERLGNPMECFDNPTPGAFTLEPSLQFFANLSRLMNDQANVIDRVFPKTIDVMIPFLDRVADDVISEFITPILDEAHEREVGIYLKAVSGVFQHMQQFCASLVPTAAAKANFEDEMTRVIGKIFEPHVDLYLQEELDYFKRVSQKEIGDWEKKIREADKATESRFMSNVNREADKRDFLSSFKKVILMPVSVIPLPTLPTFGMRAATSANAPKALDTSPYPGSFASEPSSLTTLSRPDTPGSIGRAALSTAVATPAAPTTELSAKAAIMNSRLEGISSLFSIEVAVKLIQLAKSSLERAALFARIGGQTGEEAKEQCEAIFITLLHVLGSGHIKAGFDKALEHLSQYNPRDVSHNQLGVAPLVTFLELVHIGDLIQQMIDVFYEQELVTKKLTDRNDFLNPAAQEKKKFEQMLDERVAAGLNRGIDVLIDEVDYLFATTQQPTDFNPGIAGNTRTQVDLDIGPTATANRIVEMVRSHTGLLTGSADKNVLDVFNQEVGIRLFASICKHIKRQRISVDGAVKLISDMNHYQSYIASMKIKALNPYFNALRELSQIYLIDPSHAKQLAVLIADANRFGSIFPVEEVYEYATRREDWYRVKRDVERAMYGLECSIQ